MKILNKIIESVLQESLEYLSKNEDYKKVLYKEFKETDEVSTLSENILEYFVNFINRYIDFSEDEDLEFDDIWYIRVDDMIDKLESIELNNDEYDIDEIIDELKDGIYSEVIDTLEDVKWELDDNDNVVYRAIDIPNSLSLEAFRTKLSKGDYSSINGIGDGVGIYYAYEESGAESYWSKGSNVRTVVLKCKINDNVIDWYTTGLLTLNNLYDEEKEVRLKKNKNIKLIAMEDMDDTVIDCGFIVNTGSNDFTEKEYHKYKEKKLENSK